MSDCDHLSDQDLVRAATGELPRQRMAAAAKHLEGCGRCRSSIEDLQKVLIDYVSARRVSLDAQLPPIEAARAALERRLAAAVSEPAIFPSGSLARPSVVHWVVRVASVAAIVGVLVAAWRGRSNHDVDARFVPDPRLTPGLVANVSRSQLCSSNGAGPDPIGRPVAREVFRLHGIADPRPRAYELDYLIPPELGGSSGVRNLWPQPYDADPWNAHAKDALEDHLLNLVCGGEIELATAQRALAQDWTAAYRRYFRVDQPLVEHASFLKDEPWE